MRKYFLYIISLFTAVGCTKTPTPNLQELHGGVPEGAYVSVITGSSMEPILHDGDAIAYDARYPFRDVSTGDVCIYHNSSVNRRICHMIYSRDIDSCEMYGINNTGIDNEEMTEKNYVGKVIGFWSDSKKKQSK